jgi:hypothetical protein
MFTLQTSFKPCTFAQGGGGAVKSVGRGKENFQGFCPNYVQEFGFSSPFYLLRIEKYFRFVPTLLYLFMDPEELKIESSKIMLRQIYKLV